MTRDDVIRMAREAQSVHATETWTFALSANQLERFAALVQQAEPLEPVGWLQPKTVDAHSRPDLGYETCSKDDYGAFPVYTTPPQQEPVAWMYKGEPWFDGTRYHDKYEVTTDERLAKFKDENARPLYFAS